MVESSLNIHIKRLGAVDEAEIKLKPLTVFVGENSTGKTYSAYLISYIFSTYSFDKYRELIKANKSEKFPEIEEVLINLNKKGIALFDLKTFISKNSKKYFDIICHEIVEKNFTDFLASDTILFDDFNVDLDMENFDEIQYSHLSPHFISFNVDTCEKCNKTRNCEQPTIMTINKKILQLNLKGIKIVHRKAISALIFMN